MPPAVASIQVVIIPIPGSSPKAFQFAKSVGKQLKKFRTFIDVKEDESAGFKFNKWELKGVPVRIEIGDREAADSSLTAVLRHRGEKIQIKVGMVGTLLDKMQKELFDKHQKFTQDNTHIVNSFNEFKNIMTTKRGFIKAFWCEKKECEAKIKNETKATTRVLPLDAKKERGKCIYCGKSAFFRWLFAQAY